jgi:MarR family transcriptional regulator, organic hydroperoxide resistance regulator
LQRLLHAKIAPHGVTTGMWYFLRALWHEDGLSQSELSRRVGAMEPTTQAAIIALERKGWIVRTRDARDARKRCVRLTPAGRRLKSRLIPLARAVVGTATAGLGKARTRALLATLAVVQTNLRDAG